jgi:hypothetical protein
MVLEIRTEKIERYKKASEKVIKRTRKLNLQKRKVNELNKKRLNYLASKKRIESEKTLSNNHAEYAKNFKTTHETFITKRQELENSIKLEKELKNNSEANPNLKLLKTKLAELEKNHETNIKTLQKGLSYLGVKSNRLFKSSKELLNAKKTDINKAINSVSERITKSLKEQNKRHTVEEKDIKKIEKTETKNLKSATKTLSKTLAKNEKRAEIFRKYISTSKFGFALRASRFFTASPTASVDEFMKSLSPSELKIYKTLTYKTAGLRAKAEFIKSNININEEHASASAIRNESLKRLASKNPFLNLDDAANLNNEYNADGKPSDTNSPNLFAGVNGTKNTVNFNTIALFNNKNRFNIEAVINAFGFGTINSFDNVKKLYNRKGEIAQKAQEIYDKIKNSQEFENLKKIKGLETIGDDIEKVLKLLANKNTSLFTYSRKANSLFKKYNDLQVTSETDKIFAKLLEFYQKPTELSLSKNSRRPTFILRSPKLNAKDYSKVKKEVRDLNEQFFRDMDNINLLKHIKPQVEESNRAKEIRQQKNALYLAKLFKKYKYDLTQIKTSNKLSEDESFANIYGENGSVDGKLLNTIMSQKNLSYFKDHLIDLEKHTELHKSLGINTNYHNTTQIPNMNPSKTKLKDKLKDIELKNDDINSLLNTESNTENVLKNLTTEVRNKMSYKDSFLYFYTKEKISKVEEFLKIHKRELANRLGSPQYRAKLFSKIAHQSEILLRLKKDINKMISKAEATPSTTGTALA